MSTSRRNPDKIDKVEVLEDAIFIKKANRGKFTRSARRAGKSVQAHAHAVLANPKSTALQKKRAQFAVNSKKWKHSGRKKK